MNATTATANPASDVRIVLRGATVEVSRVSRASTWKQTLLRQAAASAQTVRVVDSVDLEIGPGEVVGFVGRNGAGKSSLLKTICGIYPQTAGERIVRGRIAPVIASTVGFDYELGIRDNIALTYAYMGRFDAFTPELADRVVAFAELEGREGIPIKKFSSGQQARLAYAALLELESDILVLDEVLTTGDTAFVGKALAAMSRKIARTPIVLIVSHELGRLRSVCTRCVWVAGGKIAADGAPDAVVDAYETAAQEGRA
jgi:ABC-type polysaccharide/polyol phosphate transport system ATPase subunit